MNTENKVAITAASVILAFIGAVALGGWLLFRHSDHLAAKARVKREAWLKTVPEETKRCCKDKCIGVGGWGMSPRYCRDDCMRSLSCP